MGLARLPSRKTGAMAFLRPGHAGGKQLEGFPALEVCRLEPWILVRTCCEAKRCKLRYLQCEVKNDWKQCDVAAWTEGGFAESGCVSLCGRVPPLLTCNSHNRANWLCCYSPVKAAQFCPTLCDPVNGTVHPGQNTGVGSHSLLQGIFPIQESNPGFPKCRRILYQLSHIP